MAHRIHTEENNRHEEVWHGKRLCVENIISAQRYALGPYFLMLLESSHTFSFKRYLDIWIRNLSTSNLLHCSRFVNIVMYLRPIQG